MSLRNRNTRVAVGRYALSPVVLVCTCVLIMMLAGKMSADFFSVATLVVCITGYGFLSITAWRRQSWCSSESIDTEPVYNNPVNVD